MKFTCPNCDHQLSVKVEDVDPAAVQRDRRDKYTGNPTILGEVALAKVFEFMVHLGETRDFTDSLYQEYGAWAREHRGPELTKNAFARALGANGGVRFRTGEGRGFDIPDLTDKKPAKPSARTQSREEKKMAEDGAFAQFKKLHGIPLTPAELPYSQQPKPEEDWKAKAEADPTWHPFK